MSRTDTVWRSPAHHGFEGGGFLLSLIQPFFNAWRFRELIRAIVWRDLNQRFRLSYFGWFWAVAAPLVLLGIYTFVHTAVMRVTDQHSGPLPPRALLIFSGLIVFHLFMELINTAPMLLPMHSSLIKRSIFPCEVLAWTSLLRSLVYSGIGLCVFLIFELALTGAIPLTALLLPILLIPLCLFLLGAVWVLAAVGAFTRDVTFLISTLAPALFFSSPVLYSAERLPASLRFVVYVNPISSYIEVARDLLLFGRLPNPLTYLIACTLAVVVFYGGYRFFMRYRSMVVDVL
jgi:lipopolysaccharide transport system permease protein